MTRKQGYLIELQFMLRASENDLHVSRPLREGLRYDLIVDYYGELSRVQVKSTSLEQCNGYRIVTSSGREKTPYSVNDIDFFAIYLIPADLWYLIPVDIINGRKNITIKPEIPDCEFIKYQENWKLIKPYRKYVIIKGKRKVIGGIYPNHRGGYQVRYGRKITKSFTKKEDAENFLTDLREQTNEL